MDHEAIFLIPSETRNFVSCHQSVEGFAHTYQHKYALCREKNWKHCTSFACILDWLWWFPLLNLYLGIYRPHGLLIWYCSHRLQGILNCVVDPNFCVRRADNSIQRVTRHVRTLSWIKLKRWSHNCLLNSISDSPDFNLIFVVPTYKVVYSNLAIGFFSVK